ncbi:MAG: 30S ribosome-binding factor RbfA [Cyclobacteriaceae bacterium]
MESMRQQKYSRMIQRELAMIFQRNLTHQLGTMMVSVTQVRMSPDLGVANVFLSFVMEKDAVTGLDKINKHKSEVRRELGKKIGKQVRVIPELIFHQDDSVDYASKIDSILDNLTIPPKKED